MRLYFLTIFVISIKLIAQTPLVFVQSVNSDTVGLYEKYEINIGLENVSYMNPYNPDEVDLQAVFTAPSGKVWEIFSFYDNYNSINQWKVRFAPNEIGTWDFYLTLNSVSGDTQSVDYSFETIESNYHGWMRVSPVNPHYFIYDDGTPFYGVGPYYPWNVNNSSTGLGQLEASGCNFWGYWNIMYDVGEIIESMNSGLGKYDQPKCGWIDQLIIWSEDRNLKMMLAIWPHDLFCNSLSGWAKQWANNPYNTICDVNDIYEDETAWQYQEKQYRYIIARWGYSRALGVWEIINEINGTDAWVAGKQNEARIWTGKVHDFLTANDPHQRPTTASMSGGQYWPEGYAEVDISNVHLYETGWLSKYSANPLRSSTYTYHNISRQLWNGFDKPAIFGEAGSMNSYGDFAAGSEEYLAMFHNALWASWASGLAATPVWWDFNSKQIMTTDVMEQMATFSEIARDYNYAYQNIRSYSIIAEDCDVYAMRSDSSFFGWIREAYANPVKNKILQFKAFEDTSYQISWYNTWTGELIDQDIMVGIDTLITIQVPEAAEEIPDVSFFAEKTAEGETPARVRIGSASTKIYVKRNERAQILCTIHDAEGRFVRSAENSIQFTLKGPGRFIGADVINAENGTAGIGFTSDSTSGTATIITSSPGLISDTLIIEVANRILIDDFDEYTLKSELEYFWFAKSGTSVQLLFGNQLNGEEGRSLRVEYAIGEGYAPYAGVYCNNHKNLDAAEFLEFWFKGDASSRTMAILINEDNGRYWQYDYSILGDEPEFISIPLSHFIANDTALSIRFDSVDEISFNILQGEAGRGEGTILLDDIYFLIPAIETAIYEKDVIANPAEFNLSQNFPNPFNPKTIIQYILPVRCHVEMKVFNVLGQKVTSLISEKQKEGAYQIEWDASQYASGIYYYQLKTDNGFIKTRKMVFIK